MELNQGKILQIQGSVVDVIFPAGDLPSIYEALLVDKEDKGQQLVLEVEKLLENNIARCVAMETTDGLRRDIAVERTGSPITVPVG